MSEGVAALSARVTPVRVLEGNDVTEYHQAGGDVRAWVMAVMGDDARFPDRTMGALWWCMRRRRRWRCAGRRRGCAGEQMAIALQK